MPTVKVKDAEIHYEAHGQGKPFIFFSETACDGAGGTGDAPPAGG